MIVNNGKKNANTKLHYRYRKYISRYILNTRKTGFDYSVQQNNIFIVAYIFFTKYINSKDLSKYATYSFLIFYIVDLKFGKLHDYDYSFLSMQ